MIDKTITIAETGWTQSDGNTMRWIGQPYKVTPNSGELRDVLEVRIRAKVDDPEKKPYVIFESATADDDEDPAADDFFKETIVSSMVELPVPAAFFLYTMLGFFVDAVERL